jgi:hypothetical protein
MECGGGIIKFGVRNGTAIASCSVLLIAATKHAKSKKQKEEENVNPEETEGAADEPAEILLSRT